MKLNRTEARGLCQESIRPVQQAGVEPPAPDGRNRDDYHLLKHAVLAGVLAWCVAILCAAPSFKDLEFDVIKITRAGDYLKLCANPLDRDLREAFLAYRIFPPLLAHVLRCGPILSLLLPYFASVAMLSVVFYAIRSRLDSAHAWAGTLVVASTSAITWPNCMVGYPDSFAHLCAAILLINRARPLMFGCVVAGLLSDERFVLALPFIWIWHGGYSPGSSWKKPEWIVLGSAFALCLLLRHGLKVGWIGTGIPMSRTYSDFSSTLRSFTPYGQTWAMWSVNAFGSFRWAWALIIVSAVLAWRKGERKNVFIFLGGASAATAGSAIVIDVTRSIGFIFPAVLVALTWLAKSNESSALRYYRWGAAVCLLTPSYWITHDFFFWWWRPLPLRTLAYLTGTDPMRWILW